VRPFCLAERRLVTSELPPYPSLGAWTSLSTFQGFSKRNADKNVGAPGEKNADRRSLELELAPEL
jgi:hypothetical protein